MIVFKYLLFSWFIFSFITFILIFILRNNLINSLKIAKLEYGYDTSGSFLKDVGVLTLIKNCFIPFLRLVTLIGILILAFFPHKALSK